MGIKNKILEGNVFFLTITVVDWVDVFTRPVYKHEIVNALRYCQQSKGLELYAWETMSNHIHLIAGTKDGFNLSDILRDFKKYISKKIIELIQTENESRKDLMLNRFEYAGRNDSKIKNFKFWQNGNEAKEIHTYDFLEQKLDYIHNNPVRAELVYLPQEYKSSSAIEYTGGKGLLDIIHV
jgi:REP element-mobilizing transposase RayT